MGNRQPITDRSPFPDNWWLVLNANDPARQLQWMINTLEEARRNRERVFIIGHIPPGTVACNHWWEEAYFKVVTKFQQTITGQFFAHMHSDQIVLDYSDAVDKENPSSVSTRSPSSMRAFSKVSIWILDSDTWSLTEFFDFRCCTSARQ